MKKLILAAALAALATPALAANFAVTNATGADYDEFYITTPGQKPSETNLLKGAPEKSFENGMTYTFKNIAPGTYDVHVYDPEDPLSDCTYKGVVFKGEAVTLTADMHKADCKS